MPSGTHVHIISAGEHIAAAYPVMIRALPTITHTYVLADSEVYDHVKDPVKEQPRVAVRDAVTAVKDLSASLAIPFSREIVFSPIYPSVHTILTKIHNEHRDARFTFDLSGGSKELCMTLLASAPWLGAEVFASFDEKTPRSVPLPERSVKGMMENPNYQTILALLLRTAAKSGGLDRTWTAREYIFGQLRSRYVPTRTKRGEPGDSVLPAARNKPVKKSVSELTHGTLSTLLRTLEEAGLVVERVSADSKREKQYRISDRGEMAFQFFAKPETSTLVRTVLEPQ